MILIFVSLQRINQAKQMKYSELEKQQTVTSFAMVRGIRFGRTPIREKASR